MRPHFLSTSRSPEILSQLQSSQATPLSTLVFRVQPELGCPRNRKWRTGTGKTWRAVGFPSKSTIFWNPGTRFEVIGAEVACTLLSFPMIKTVVGLLCRIVRCTHMSCKNSEYLFIRLLTTLGNADSEDNCEVQKWVNRARGPACLSKYFHRWRAE